MNLGWCGELAVAVTYIRLLLVGCSAIVSISVITAITDIRMTAPQFWDKSWEDLLDGTGTHLKWKAGEKNENYRIAHEFLLGHGVLGAPGTVFIPLAGDGIFAPYIYRQGHTVVAVELIEKAVASLRKRFNEGTASHENKRDVILGTGSPLAVILALPLPPPPSPFPFGKM